ncbi:hypothetical protein Drorol1_Dr00026432 [Drosera rotundifolia]
MQSICSEKSHDSEESKLAENFVGEGGHAVDGLRELFRCYRADFILCGNGCEFEGCGCEQDWKVRCSVFVVEGDINDEGNVEASSLLTWCEGGFARNCVLHRRLVGSYQKGAWAPRASPCDGTRCPMIRCCVPAVAEWEWDESGVLQPGSVMVNGDRF